MCSSRGVLTVAGGTFHALRLLQCSKCHVLFDGGPRRRYSSRGGPPLAERRWRGILALEVHLGVTILGRRLKNVRPFTMRAHEVDVVLVQNFTSCLGK